MAEHCKDCRAPITWLPNGEGRPIPVEPRTVGPRDVMFTTVVGHIDHRSLCRARSRRGYVPRPVTPAPVPAMASIPSPPVPAWGGPGSELLDDEVEF